MSDVRTRPVTVLDEQGNNDRQPCDWHGCKSAAVVAMRFRDQAGHIHDCAAHAAVLREFCDVVESRPLPCSWPHDGSVWTDQPRELL